MTLPSLDADAPRLSCSAQRIRLDTAAFAKEPPRPVLLDQSSQQRFALQPTIDRPEPSSVDRQHANDALGAAIEKLIGAEREAARKQLLALEAAILNDRLLRRGPGENEALALLTRAATCVKRAMRKESKEIREPKKERLEANRSRRTGARWRAWF